MVVEIIVYDSDREDIKPANVVESGNRQTIGTC